MEKRDSAKEYGWKMSLECVEFYNKGKDKVLEKKCKKFWEIQTSEYMNIIDQITQWLGNNFGEAIFQKATLIFNWLVFETIQNYVSA